MSISPVMRRSSGIRRRNIHYPMGATVKLHHNIGILKSAGWAVVLLFGFVARPSMAQEGWRSLGHNDAGATFYWDKGAGADLLQYRDILTVFGKAQEGVTAIIESIKVDCAAGTYSQIRTEKYNDTGAKISADTPSAGQVPFAPGTLLHDVACSPRFQPPIVGWWEVSDAIQAYRARDQRPGVALNPRLSAYRLANGATLLFRQAAGWNDPRYSWAPYPVSGDRHGAVISYNRPVGSVPAQVEIVTVRDRRSAKPPKTALFYDALNYVPGQMPVQTVQQAIRNEAMTVAGREMSFFCTTFQGFVQKMTICTLDTPKAELLIRGTEAGKESQSGIAVIRDVLSKLTFR